MWCLQCNQRLQMGLFKIEDLFYKERSSCESGYFDELDRVVSAHVSAGEGGGM